MKEKKKEKERKKETGRGRKRYKMGMRRCVEEVQGQEKKNISRNQG